MSEHLTAAAQALNAPEVLVERSAAARAQASGTSVEEVLAAWAGGGAVSAPAPAETAAPEPEPEPAPQEAGAGEAPAPEVVSPEPEPAPAAAAVAVAAAPEVEEEPVEAIPLRVRARVGGRTGALVGAVTGLFLVVFSAPWTLPRVGLVGTEGDLAAGIDLVPGWLIAGHALVSLVVGASIASLTRAFTGWRGRGMQLVSSKTVTLATGAVVGALAGALVAAVVAGSGTVSALDETMASVSVASLLGWSIAGWAFGGWIIGILVQAVGVPAGVVDDEAEESDVVRHRLRGAFALPIVSVASILLLVLPAAYVFIQFPAWAPVIGVFIAGSILGFAGLSASRPGVKISAGEFLAAAAGVAVVVVIVLAVLNAQGAGHGEEHSEGEAVAAVLS
jgi:hypothetical protein